MKYSIEIFDKFDVQYEIIISSTIKSVKKMKQCILDIEKKGAVIFITASSIVFNLYEMVRSLTIKPVICNQINSSNINEAINTAYFAIQILAITDKELDVKLKEDRIIQEKKIEINSKNIEA